jgi:hypothetical protein
MPPGRTARGMRPRASRCRAIAANLCCGDRLSSISSQATSPCANPGSCRRWLPARPADLHAMVDLRNLTRSTAYRGWSGPSTEEHRTTRWDTAAIRPLPAGGDFHGCRSGAKRNSRSGTARPGAEPLAIGSSSAGVCTVRFTYARTNPWRKGDCLQYRELCFLRWRVSLSA